MSFRAALRSFGLAVAAGVLALASPAASQNTGPRYYTVADGDTLWSIAQRFHVTASELVARNHQVTNPSALRRGMRLHLPSRAIIPAAPAAPPTARPTSPAHPTPPTPATPAHPQPTNHNHREGGGRWGRPSHPGIVHLVRVADSEAITIDTRRVGPVTLRRMRAFLRASSGETHPIDGRLVRQLGMFSDHFGGRTLEVISGFRPRRRRQWTRHSKHNLGHAVDFRIVGVPNRVARDYCRTLAATGCGFYPRSVFIHMDTRDVATYWVDWSRPGERPRYGSESHPPPERTHPAAGANPLDTPDPEVPPVGAEQEVDDVADDTPAVRTATPRADDNDNDGDDSSHEREAPPPATPGTAP